MNNRLILILGDQLTHSRAALKHADPQQDVIVMAEVAAEAQYVLHNRHKIALIFAAMRHFRLELEEQGYRVIYFHYDLGISDLRSAVGKALETCDAESLLCCEPGEQRLSTEMERWQLDIPFERVADDRFLIDHASFQKWASGRKQLRMEHFYRDVRRQYDLLMGMDGKPEGDRWNYDAENRQGWRGKCDVPERPALPRDDITEEAIALVQRAFPDNPGDLQQFDYATTRTAALTQLQWFLENGLPRFGQYQDAISDDSPWLFHAALSMYINIGLLDPLEVCQAVESSYRKGLCELAAAEGFIRQIAGWREYIRGVYWLHMPGYDDRNHLGAHRPLPDWFWTADVDMRCLSKALAQSLELGYAHHIQRLMVIGNFCLLAGADVREVCAWYLGVYVDAFEWVELPNTLGMALHADGGLMASKPYAASGKYIQRQGDHCKQCIYSPAAVTGDKACPFNSLYWHFIDRHRAEWEANPRMGLTVRNWTKKTSSEQTAILKWAETVLDKYCPERA